MKNNNVTSANLASVIHGMDRHMFNKINK